MTLDSEGQPRTDQSNSSPVPGVESVEHQMADVVRIHTAPEERTTTDLELTKPSTIQVQPSKDSTKFSGVHVQREPTPTVPGELPPVQIAYSGIKFGVDVTHDKVVEHRQILKGCDGTFNPGRLTAVMGASGAGSFAQQSSRNETVVGKVAHSTFAPVSLVPFSPGKTSLMNIVSGNPTAGRIEGRIRVNGVDCFDSMQRIRELSAYIQQDDVLMGTMTVREAVTLSARLRLPKSMPDSEKLQRVEDVIEMLGLTKCIDTIIGDNFNKGVSGGEKRRVSMALELIKSPAVLFLDEPTSGLDTYTAHSIVGMLRDIAHTQGKTIVCTIHQPSSDIYHMFDDLVLMADGQIMYHGDAAHAVEYFNERGMVCPENFNPADHLFMKVLYSMDQQLKMITEDMSRPRDNLKNESSSMILADREAESKAAYDAMAKAEKERVAQLLEEWKKSPEWKALAHEVANPLTSPLPDPSQVRAERPGEFYAFLLLSRRRWYDLLRDKMKVRMQFAQYLFFSILLGLIFLRIGHDQNSVQDREGCLFFVCVQALFMSFMSNLNTFGPEKLVMMREMESGLYGLPSYFFSRWIIELPFRVIFPFMYAVILYWMIGFQATGEKFILFAIALILLDNCGTCMAVMICSVFPEVQQAMQAGPAFILPLMVFSGFYVNLGGLGWWFRWISYLSPVRYGYGAVIKNEMDGLTFECVTGASCIPNGDAAIRLLSMTEDPGIGLNLFILLILVGGFLCGAFAFMWKTTKKK